MIRRRPRDKKFSWVTMRMSAGLRSDGSAKKYDGHLLQDNKGDSMEPTRIYLPAPDNIQTGCWYDSIAEPLHRT